MLWGGLVPPPFFVIRCGFGGLPRDNRDSRDNRFKEYPFSVTRSLLSLLSLDLSQVALAPATRRFDSGVFVGKAVSG